eukprot:TRINITY_DN85362_c0_g1_i1.p1 TRINITY_DN85362_c0_g1~~TRINITY_DN85362_c0_g1_i1.p1  ORF type:complete len:167 (+),score=10.60 TRINITY_DN85362_c0_g1_i1:59-559(+)
MALPRLRSMLELRLGKSKSCVPTSTALRSTARSIFSLVITLLVSTGTPLLEASGLVFVCVNSVKCVCAICLDLNLNSRKLNWLLAETQGNWPVACVSTFLTQCQSIFQLQFSEQSWCWDLIELELIDSSVDLSWTRARPCHAEMNVDAFIFNCQSVPMKSDFSKKK